MKKMATQWENISVKEIKEIKTSAKVSESERIEIRISKELKADIERVAKDNEMTMSQLLKIIIKKGLKEYDNNQ